MSQIIYPITHLPPVIDIGKQTEKGVTRVGFDVHEWLDDWPGMRFSVQPTRPGETEAYTAATDMVGSVIFWLVGAVDTEKPGSGTVEVLGVTEDERKLSFMCRTAIANTNTVTTAEIPEPGRPWLDQVIMAGETAKADAKNAAQSAQEAVQAASDAGQYSANADKQAASAAQSAVYAGQYSVSAEQDAKSALDSANTAKKAANDADVSKKDAETYASHGKVYAENALTYSRTAMEHKNSTEQFAASALNNANDAKSYKESASNSASNAYNSYTGSVNAANIASQKANEADTSEKKASVSASGAAESEAKASAYATSAAANAVTSAEKADSAAASAAAAAKSAEQADKNPADVYVVKKIVENGTIYVDKTPEQITTAALNGKACVLVRENIPYMYIGITRNLAGINEGDCPTFAHMQEENGVIRQSFQYVCADRRLQGVTYDAMAKNPSALKLTGAVDAEYDGSNAVEVEVPDVFIVRKKSNSLSHTASEVAKAAITDKRVCLMIDEVGSKVFCYTGTEYDPVRKDTAMVFTAPGYFQSDDNQAGIRIDRYRLYMDGTLLGGISFPATTPNPHPLHIIGAVEAEYDGSKAVTVEIPAGGGGSGGTWVLECVGFKITNGSEEGLMIGSGQASHTFEETMRSINDGRIPVLKIQIEGQGMLFIPLLLVTDEAMIFSMFVLGTQSTGYVQSDGLIKITLNEPV